MAEGAEPLRVTPDAAAPALLAGGDQACVKDAALLSAVADKEALEPSREGPTTPAVDRLEAPEPSCEGSATPAAEGLEAPDFLCKGSATPAAERLEALEPSCQALPAIPRVEALEPSSEGTVIPASGRLEAPLDRSASAEEQRRAEIQQKAKEDLAKFHEQRRREIEERQQRNRARSEPVPAAPMSAISPGSSLPDGFVAAAMSDPSKAAALQQLLSSRLMGGSMQSSLPTMLGATLASGAAMPTAAPVPPTPQALAVRVREPGTATFRRVVLSDAEAIQPPSFQEVESRINQKFRTARGPDGNELGPRKLVRLVRICDCLEVGDDEDTALLQADDELEVTFASA